ncbi:MAG: hypothetical protein K9K64_12090, partial [Desulfohalobiaceae bacterium]|nr:hypothetical protein [Desulfohalobiaceae bacterium]
AAAEEAIPLKNRAAITKQSTKNLHWRDINSSLVHRFIRRTKDRKSKVSTSFRVEDDTDPTRIAYGTSDIAREASAGALDRKVKPAEDFFHTTSFNKGSGLSRGQALENTGISRLRHKKQAGNRSCFRTRTIRQRILQMVARLRLLASLTILAEVR